MSKSRTKMIRALKEIVVPTLRERGFKGSFPHFRRPLDTRIDLLSFQFDKWGGGFLIEISNCEPSGITTYWGEKISPKKVRAIDNHPDRRYRIKPGEEGSRDNWFRFDQYSIFKSSGRFNQVATSVLPYLEEAEDWWEHKLIDPDKLA
jgi:hypothetical protein